MTAMLSMPRPQVLSEAVEEALNMLDSGQARVAEQSGTG